GATNYIIERSYFHGWSHGSLASGTQDYTGMGIVGYTGGDKDTGGVAFANVFDGSDTARDSFLPIYGAPETIYDNVFNYYTSAQGTTVTVHDNLFMNVVASFDPSAHEDMW